MDLIAAGIVVFALLLASYSTGGDWISLASRALSIVALGGGVFLYTASESSGIRDGVAELSKTLPSGWDRRAQDLSAALERASVALARARKTPAKDEPILAGSISDWFSWGSSSETKPQAEPEAEPKAAEPTEAKPIVAEGATDGADVPIKWLLDEPSPANETFALSGANVSSQPLKDVKAVLKPDSGAKVFLTLQLDGSAGETASAIPPGTRFSLAAAALTKDKAEQLGGAILSVSYVQDGNRKTSIMYLAPPTMATLTASN